MLNFRYHVVSLVAVFLALAIGVIMGTTVLDRAIVDRLEDQQAALRADIDEARATNATLQAELDRRRTGLDQLHERVVDGALDGVPTLVVGVRGAEPAGWEELRDDLADAAAGSRGELWLTERFALASEDDVVALADVLGASTDDDAGALRATALTRLAEELRLQAEEPTEGAEGGEPVAPEPVLGRLVEAGFLERPGGGEEGTPVAVPGTVAVVVADGTADVVGRDVVTGLAGELATSDGPGATLPVVVVEALGAEAEDGSDGGEVPDEVLEESVTVAVRDDDDLRRRLSTVDHLGRTTGRIAAVLAVGDAAAGRTGHYGTAPGAARLVPAPAGAGGEG